MKRIVLITALVLGACADGDSTDGIEAQVGAVAHRHDAAAAVKHSTSTYKSFRRQDGMRIDLQHGLLSVSAVALEPCGVQAARIGATLLDALLPAAHAHGAHAGTAGGVIDVVAQADMTRFDLGTLPAAPGDYCGLIVELLPATLEVEHGDHHKSAASQRALFVSPCYYPNTVGVAELPEERTDDNAALFEHDCIEAAYSGPALRANLPFTQSLTLDSAQRRVEITVGTAYDRWFEGIAMDRLETDADEQARLAAQVLGTLHVHGVPAPGGQHDG